MTLVGKETQPEIRALPLHKKFEEGFAAGMVNPVTEGEIQDITRILSTIPVDQWLSTEQLQYACGLLAGWLPEWSYREVRALLQQG